MDKSPEALAQAVLGRIFIELEDSARHVHLTEAQAQALFGHGLTQDRPLSQPGQFLARERVDLVGPKGTICRFAVLGPARKEAQVEISVTDGRLLGIRPPVRQSGDVAGTPGILLSSSRERIAIREGVIAARRHVHLTPETAERFHVTDGQTVQLQTFTQRPTIFQDVVVRVSRDFADRAHLDLDEANACGMEPGDLGRILS